MWYVSSAQSITWKIFCAGDQSHSVSPVTPSELLIALHNIDCTNDDSLMKASVKGA